MRVIDSSRRRTAHNATDMPLIGPYNAITLQSSKTNLRMRDAKNFCASQSGRPFAHAREPAHERCAHTFSAARSCAWCVAHRSRAYKRSMQSTPISACDHLFFRLICHAKVNRTFAEDIAVMNQPDASLDQKLAEIRKPAYLAIPDLIEEDLATGRLRPRDRLPGLRDLADAAQPQLHDGRARVCGSAQARPARFARGQRHLRARPHADVAARRAAAASRCR